MPPLPIHLCVSNTSKVCPAGQLAAIKLTARKRLLTEALAPPTVGPTHTICKRELSRAATYSTQVCAECPENEEPMVSRALGDETC